MSSGLKNAMIAHEAAKKRLQQGGGSGPQLGPRCMFNPRIPGPICTHTLGGTGEKGQGQRQGQGPPGPQISR